MAYHDTDMGPATVLQGKFLGWRQDPMTIEVFKHLEKRIKEIEEDLGTGGGLNHSSATETLANTAREVGKIEGIREIFDLVIE